MGDFKQAVDSYVDENGVGAHFEYKESGRKIRNADGKPKVIFDNINTITKLAELLAQHAEDFIKLTKYSKYLGMRDYERSDMDIMSYYFEAIYDIAPEYDRKYGKSFSNFFIERLNSSFQDMYKKDKTVGKDMFGREERISRLDSYYATTDEGDEVEKTELGSLESEYEAVEEKGRVFELALQIIRILCSLKRTQASMSRLFFTDDVIYWIEDESDEENLRVNHADEIFKELEQGLLDYLLNGNIESLVDILINEKKTFLQLYESIDDITSDQESLAEYKSVFESKKKDLGDLTQVPSSPLGNNMLLAYLFYSDVKQSKETNEKPVMHASAYITKYRDYYKSLLKEFIDI